MRIGINRPDTVTFGKRPGSPGKTVEVRKIAIAEWRELFSVVYALPQLIIGAMSTPADERAAYLVVALDQSLEEISHIVAVLTGLDADWIEHNVSLDELVDYFTAMVRVNNFEKLLKNVRGVLAPTAGTAEQDAN